nr:DinB family protein [Bacillus halotolerans]
MFVTDAKQFYDYHSWANKRILNHIEHLPEGTAYQEVKSVFPSVSDVLLHMCRADYIWLNVLSGVDYQEIIDGTGKFESAHGNMTAIKQHASELELQYHHFFSRQTDLEQTFSMQHPKLGTLESTYADTILHVVNHGTYHRGNVTAMLRQLGHSGVPTDYMYFLYEKRESKG